MSTFKIKEKEGSLFSNADKKKTDKHPDYTGSCVINNEKLYISAWINVSESGKKYMRMKFDEPMTGQTANTTPAPDFEKKDESIPF
mgnify:CR=1 FL=1